VSEPAEKAPENHLKLLVLWQEHRRRASLGEAVGQVDG